MKKRKVAVVRTLSKKNGRLLLRLCRTKKKGPRGGRTTVFEKCVKRKKSRR